MADHTIFLTMPFPHYMVERELSTSLRENDVSFEDEFGLFLEYQYVRVLIICCEFE